MSAAPSEDQAAKEERERAERRQRLQEMTWDASAAEFAAAEKAAIATEGQGPAQACAVTRLALTSAAERSRQASTEESVALAECRGPREQFEVLDRRAQEEQQKIEQAEQELARLREAGKETEAQKQQAKEALDKAQELCATTVERKRRADEQLAETRAQFEAANTRREAFEGKVRSRDMSKFTVPDILELLCELGLGAHCAKFREEKVKGISLEKMDEDDLIKLGMTNLAERKRLMHAMRLISIVGLVRLPAATILHISSDAEVQSVLLVATKSATEVSQWLQEKGVDEAARAKLVQAGVTGEVLLNLKKKELGELCSDLKLGELSEIANWAETASEKFFNEIYLLFVKQQQNKVRPDAGLASASTSALVAAAEAAAPPSHSAAAVPVELICPITREVMRDPVLAADGFSYERTAIQRWLSDHNTSPMTGAPLSDKTLRPNDELRAQAEKRAGEKN